MSDNTEDRGLEQRSFTITDVELRAAGDDGMVTLAGYASTFNDPYSVHDRFGAFSETILPGAWENTLSTRASKIHLLVGHGAIPIPLASSRAGSLRLSEDSHGLAFEADINPQRSGLHQDVAYAVESRAMDEMSVGMQIPTGGDRWNDENTQRWISRADLIEISVLSRGANANTTAGVRSEDLLAEIRHLQTMLEAQGANETAERHVVGLMSELARLNKRRYTPIS